MVNRAIWRFFLACHRGAFGNISIIRKKTGGDQVVLSLDLFWGGWLLLVDPTVLLQSPSFRRQRFFLFPAGRQRDFGVIGLVPSWTDVQCGKFGGFFRTWDSGINYFTAFFRFQLKMKDQNPEIIKTLWILSQNIEKQAKICYDKEK